MQLFYIISKKLFINQKQLERKLAKHLDKF